MTRREFSRLAFRWGAFIVLGGVFYDKKYLTLFKNPSALAIDDIDRWVYSTCTFCAVGCGVWLGVKDGHVTAAKGMADHPDNWGYLCVKGIYQYQVIHSKKRGTMPLIREDNDLVAASWEESLDVISQKFNEIIENHGPDAFAIYHGNQLIQEEYYLITKLANGGIGTKNIDVNSRLCSLSATEGFSRSFDESVTPGNFEDLEKADCIIIAGHNPAESHPVLFYRLKKAKEERGPTIILIDPRRTPTADIADYHLALKAGTDTVLFNSIINVLIKARLIDNSFIEKYTANFDNLAKSVEGYTPEKASEITKIPADTIRKIALKFGEADSSLILWSVGINHKTDGTRLVNLFNNICLITGNIGRPGTGPFYMEGQGSSSGPAGSITTLPGGREFDEDEDRGELAELWQVPLETIPTNEGIFTTEMWEEMEEGKIKALWVIGTNPMLSMPDLNKFKNALLNLELLVVQDCYPDTSTAKMADVFLPAAMWSEKTGTFVNSERRVNLIEKAVDPPGEALPDWKIFRSVGKRMGYSDLVDFDSTEEIFNEWREISKGTKKDMYGITYEKIESQRGVRYPCRSFEDPGTDRLYSDLKFLTSHGKARLITARFFGPAEETDEEYPFQLLTGRVLQLWMTNTRTRLSPDLMSEVGPPFAQISPEDAALLDIDEFEEIRLVSRRGTIKLKAEITDRVLPGNVFVPFHFSEAPVNLLTVNEVDPYSKEPALKSSAVKIEKSQKD